MMVDISLLQSLSYVAAAIGVCAAAVYYMMVLRATQTNQRLTLESRRIGTVLEITKKMQEVDNSTTFFEVMHYEWRDYDDYARKYSSENNVEAAGKLFTLFNRYNSNGALLRKGIVGIEDLYDHTSMGVIWLWAKYRPIIEESRRRYSGKYYLRDLEYLAGEMLRYVKERDPSYEVPDTLLRYVPDE